MNTHLSLAILHKNKVYESDEWMFHICRCFECQIPGSSPRDVERDGSREVDALQQPRQQRRVVGDAAQQIRVGRLAAAARALSRHLQHSETHSCKHDRIRQRGENKDSAKAVHTNR